jgi:serine/threonine protein kinase
MTPERWQQIDQLFHAALVYEPAQRGDFLVSACDGDESLRLEVESLISSHQEAESFIETPPGDVAAQMLGANEYAFAPGDQINNYRIVRHLGSGGMGEVYLADDIRLNRKIALKLLPPHFTVNPDRVRRFEREARAASALNHPNIVTIYEIGQSDSTHFIATEFVDGKTLRELLNEKPFTLRETLNVGIQIAGALTGAHAAGIVHRDIKPENIMLRADGYVKILDFGLAKLTEQQTSESDLETPTLLQSNPGLVMGTVQYMSPEQARAKRVDARTDIWSAGIVLYELLTGHVPFVGDTPSHVMVALMENELPPLAGYANVPAELERIVTTALQKNKKERYQNTGQLGRDLKDLKQELQLEARLKGLLEAVPDNKAGAQTFSRPAGAATGSLALQSGRTRSSFSGEYLSTEIRRPRTIALSASFVLLIAAIGMTYWLVNRNKRPGSVSSSGQSTKRGTTSDDAYRNYIQGKNLVNQRNPAEVKKAIEYFQEAIRLDPNYAQAYAGLASSYFGAENSKAEAAVEKALQLDSNLAEAYAVRAFIEVAVKWDFTAAETDLVHAIELEPNNDTAHWVYAMLLADTSRFDQAIREIETAQAIAPGTHAYERDRGRILFSARRYDEAIVQLKRAIELKPDSHSAFSWIVRAHEMKGDQAGAFDWFIRWRELKHTDLVEEYRQAYAAGGWLAVKRKFLDFVKHGKDYPEMGAYEIAGNLILLGETTQAFVYLNKAVEKREWEVTMLNMDPLLDGVRGDPRFTELLKRAKFK